MEKLGQYFLKNPEKIEIILDSLDIRPDDCIIEIGPGHGELLFPLLERVKRMKNIRVIAIEKDENLAYVLESKTKEAGLGSITIIEGDIRRLLPRIHEVFPPLALSTPYKLVGNIPYYLTGYLFRLISELRAKPTKSVFTIQKEVAERISTTPPRMNLLAASIQVWAEAKIITHISRNDFSPKPGVDSAVILLEKKGDAIPEKYHAFVRALFKQPRKTIINNLALLAPREKIKETLMRLALAPHLRPQDVSIEKLIELARNFKNEIKELPRPKEATGTH